jgi:N-carbamoylputrescine amidase
MARNVNISVVQQGPAHPDKEKNVTAILQALDDVKEQEPDFVLFPETATTQFFSVGLKKPEFFDLAEPVPGPTTEIVGAKARELGTHVILPLFEKGRLEGQYYNSAVLIGPDGNVIEGILPDGTAIPAYRKNYISDFLWGTAQNDEKYYFSPGPGYPIFDTEIARVGILVCYDRMHPEGYKILALQGAEIVFVPVASTGFVKDLFVAGLRTHALENAFVVAGCNKSGVEAVEDREVPYYGNSAIVGVNGSVLAQAPEDEPGIIHASVDLDSLKDQRRRMFVYRDRRPDLYGIISER